MIPLESPDAFLDAVYEELDYIEGELLNATSFPRSNTPEAHQWVEKGDWLSLAAKVGVEKVFFVKNDPVLIFYKFDREPSETEMLNLLRKAWSMARPHRIFIAFRGELRIYSLSQTPSKSLDDWEILESIHSSNDVLEQLKRYHRAEIESYHFLETGKRFGTIEQRADRQLIRDLKQVRKELLASGLSAEVAHALIGRSIFVRYLEDRGVLEEKDFTEVASGNPQWTYILQEQPEKPIFSFASKPLLYERVLRDKEFTIAFFDKLKSKFNGDLFPIEEKDWDLIDATPHLQLIRQFLFGDTDPNQPQLFFWAYAFEVIPIELISNIYEEFYHQNTEKDDKGTHYTPSALVDFVLSNTLTEDRLQTTPRLIDPACGSGIFLVESYRRMVRYWMQVNEGEYPSPKVLRKILREQICGIELNREAIYVSAFSLYLALLHYQDPPTIRQYQLPHLIYKEGVEKNDEYYQILHRANAFDLTTQEYDKLKLDLINKGIFPGRVHVERILQANNRLDLPLYSFDVVVGNPPWEQLGEKIPFTPCGELPPISIKKEDLPKSIKYNITKHELQFTDLITQAHLDKVKRIFPASYYTLLKELKDASENYFQPRQWAKVFDRNVGDNSYSQLFVHRALSLVKVNGIVGFLIHSSVLLNQRSTSVEFRKQWLTEAQIQKIVNFIDVRRVYFERGIAPFIFTKFSSRSLQDASSSFIYTSAKKSKAIELSKAVILTNYDKKVVEQQEVLERDYLWKTYWWGNHRDAQLIAKLNTYPSLESILDTVDTMAGFGFQKGSSPPLGMLRDTKPLNSRKMIWYGPLNKDWFESLPKGIKTNPDQRLYTGQRLIVGEGIKKDGVCIRLEYDDFPFRHTILGIPLKHLAEWQAKLIVGIFWSSLGKYTMFLTFPHWGSWYDKINKHDILSMPIHLPQERDAIVNKIIKVVDKIRNLQPHDSSSLFSSQTNMETLSSMQNALNKAVIELFNLPSHQQDLINDFIEYKFDLFINGSNSSALDPIQTKLTINQGTISDLPQEVKRNRNNELEAYLLTFLQVWNAALEDINGELHWSVFRSKYSSQQGKFPPLIAILFSSQTKGQNNQISTNYHDNWQSILNKLNQNFRQPISQRIYIDGMIRAVSETSIVIIKRDESQFWTRSFAREDAEATMLQVMNLQQIKR